LQPRVAGLTDTHHAPSLDPDVGLDDPNTGSITMTEVIAMSSAPSALRNPGT
jgi:hypothetical protein